MLDEVVDATPWVKKYGMENQFGIGQASHIRTLRPQACFQCVCVGASAHNAQWLL